MIQLLLIIVLVVLLIGGLPHLGYAPANWGYYPSGGIGIVLIILLVLLLAGRL